MSSSPVSSSIRIRVGGVYVRDEHILLVRHRKDGDAYWLLPGGGVEPGETLAQALERELQEECGVATRTEDLLFLSEAIAPDGARHIVNATFRGRLLQGEPFLRERGDRIDEVAWISRGHLEGLRLFPDFARQLITAWDEGFRASSTYLGNLWRT
ncbi:MAG: NUDIX domain-containing protein [Polyangiaceae bacterium]